MKRRGNEVAFEARDWKPETRLKALHINGKDLTLEAVREVAVERRPVLLDPDAREAVDRARAVVDALVAEVEALRRELAQQRGKQSPAGESKPPLPGAAPTDAKLTGLLREFIRPTNDDATVDRVLSDVKSHIQDDAGLTQQARDGWIRVLHLEYGTDYAKRKGREFVDSLKKP